MSQTLTVTGLVGLEQIERAAFFVLFDGLNANIALTEEFMAQSDEDFATRTGRDFEEATSIERIDDANFHQGHRPSLIDAPVENYPNVSISAIRATPSAENDLLDQMTSYRDNLVVEIMVKSINSEEETVRRVHRTAEAVNLTIMQNPSLGGVVSDTATPVMEVSNVFTRKQRTAYGPHWFWQGARLEYAVRKEAILPSSGSMFRAASGSTEMDYSQFIDQG